MILAACLLAGPLLPAGAAAANQLESQITSFQVESFAEQCLKLLQNGSFPELARQFHVPDESEDTFRSAEQQALAGSLEKLVGLFGSPDKPILLKEPQKAHQLAVQGLRQSYWEYHDRFFPASFGVQFAREGEGTVAFQVVVYNNRLQLRSIAFGLPESAAGSNQRIAALAKEMQQTK